MKQLSVLVLLMAAMGSVQASGGFGGNAGRLQTQVVDPLYEEGKAVFNGKTSRHGKIDYCVRVPGSSEVEKLRRKTLKSFKRSKVREFAESLHDCNMPDRKIAEVLGQEDFRAIIYYLNKRYRLKLTS